MTEVERAYFAVTSRLLACLVTESLLDGIYIPINSSEARGFCAILSTQDHAKSDRDHSSPPHILATIPLYHEPVLKVPVGCEGYGKIGLIDPMDMLPTVYAVKLMEGDSPEPVRSILIIRYDA